MNKNNSEKTKKLDNKYTTSGYSNGFLNGFTEDPSSAENPNITSSFSDATSKAKAKGQLDNKYAINGYSNGFLNGFTNDPSNADGNKDTDKR